MVAYQGSTGLGYRFHKGSATRVLLRLFKDNNEPHTGHAVGRNQGGGGGGASIGGNPCDNEVLVLQPCGVGHNRLIQQMQDKGWATE